MKIAHHHALTKIKNFLSSIIFNYCNKKGIYTLQSSEALNQIGNKFEKKISNKIQKIRKVFLKNNNI